MVLGLYNILSVSTLGLLHDLRNLSEGPPDVLDSIRNHKDFIERPLRMLRKAPNCTDEDVFTRS